MTYKSREDRNAVIETNLPLVVSRVKKLNKDVFDDDLFQEGIIGLIQAVDRFDENRGVTFSTYAVRYIDGYIMRHQNLNKTIKPVKRNGKYQHATIYSFEDFNDNNDDGGVVFRDVIPDNGDMEEKIISNVVVENFLKRLNPRGRQIIELAVYDDMTLRDIGKKVGLSQEWVRKIKKHIQKYTDSLIK